MVVFLGGALAGFLVAFAALYVYIHREYEQLRVDLKEIFDTHLLYPIYETHEGDPDQPAPELN